MEKKTINDKICAFLLPVAWSFILLFCVLILFSTKGHCADSNYPLPFVVNNNVDLFDSYQSGVTSGSYSQGASLYNDGVIGWFAWESGRFTQHFMIPVHDNYEDFYTVTYNTGTFEDFDVVYNRLTLNFDGGGTSSSDYANRKYVHVYFKQTSQNVTGGTYNTTKQATALSKAFGFNAASFYNINYLTTPLKDADGNIIITPAGNGVIGTGHATPPEEFHNPFFNPNSHAQPPEEVPPSVTINNYTWNTYNPPTIDDTDIISTLKSLIYVVNYLVGWFKDNLSGEFQNLLSNLSAFFDYIGQTIQYYGGLIISNIQNGIETFYNNMVSLFEPMFAKITEVADLFIHPFDEEVFEDQIGNSDFLNAYNEFSENAEILNAIFDNAEERDYFSLYISFENPFADTNHRIISSEINFNWLVPLRSVYRPFLWVCTLVELFVGGARVLTHILGGKGV